MALATQCPHCHTTFRVAHDQLKLRAGMVRCGACQQVFNGVEHLLRPDDAAPAATSAAATVPAIAEVSALLTPEPPATSPVTVTADATPAQPAADELTPAASEISSEIASVPVPEPASDIVPVKPAEPLDFGMFLEPFMSAPHQTDDALSELAAEPMAPPADQASTATQQDHLIDHAAGELPESYEQTAKPAADPEHEQPAVTEPHIAAAKEPEPLAARIVAPPPSPSAAHVAKPIEEEQDSLLRMTLMRFADTETYLPDQLTPSAAPDPAAPPATHDAIDDATDDTSGAHDDGPTAPSDVLAPSFFSLGADEAALSDAEEPEFVRRGRRQQRTGRVLRVGMAVASVALLCGLLLQGIVNFRQQIAGFMPTLQPVLDQVCANIDCQTRLAAQIDQLSIDANTELQTLTTGSDDYALVLLLRNRSGSNQAWPHIELTLNDANDAAVARRVFSPRDYLPTGQSLTAGFAPQSEQPVRILFALSQLKASAYRVAVFYP